MKKTINKIKQYYEYKPNIIRHILMILLIILSFKYKLLLLIIVLAILFALIFMYFNNNRLLKQAQGNGIIYGGRGKGKGVLLNYIIRKDKTKPFCNVPYSNAEILIDVAEYINSIEPNTIDDFINNQIKVIPKNEKFEGRNIYLDDVNVYFPNWNDNLLKKKYPSLPPMLAINRHLYGAHCIITTQDRERPYKILKELQSDFSIKVLKTMGWSFFWNCIPLLNYFVATKYIYYELPQATDKLPFKAVGAINETLKHGYLTSGQATKEVYEAENGIIKYGYCIQLKKHISYDTRYFHKVVYGKPAPKK